jgi:hypothetical protein
MAESVHDISAVIATRRPDLAHLKSGWAYHRQLAAENPSLHPKKAYLKEYRQVFGEKGDFFYQPHREVRLRDVYGEGSRSWEERYTSQEGKCAICRREFSTLSARPSVDHCHKTGLVRGLLCSTCNRLLGMFGDDLTQAIAMGLYLAQSQVASADQLELGEKLLAELKS